MSKTIVFLALLILIVGASVGYAEEPAPPKGSLELKTNPKLLELEPNKWFKLHEDPKDKENLNIVHRGSFAACYDSKRGRIIILGCQTRGAGVVLSNSPFFFDPVECKWTRAYPDDPIETYRENDEGIFVARPHVFLGDHAGVAVEGSYQAQQRGVLNIATNQPVHAKVWRFGLMPYLSPSGPGVFKRPVLRLIMAFTQRNDDARALYAYDDVFARRKVEQFYGIGAEWWFNSSSYGQ